ncbi:nucleoside 2-deoxyribosyltransferase domain-containing protein [Candidatus Pacearchaeota archaeon]|nr:nucleoside 2-deoxyribosyltransferase domain-containing protein [Candidatus Pacearchaeota archaeon]
MRQARYIEAPEKYEGHEYSLFMGGGISGCPDWQSDLASLLKDTSLTLLNPRRADFSLADQAASKMQIEWEFTHLKKADAILFWFPKETLCPITLYELGVWSASAKKLFIGTHPDYKRAFDVECQIQLARPEIEVVHDIQHLAAQVKAWLQEEGKYGI